ncbi:MAG: class I SAM-dependent methyltransferase [Colwellia sp.]
MESSRFWSQYWQQNNVTSFGSSLKNGYTGALKEQWGSVFEQLKDEEKVLDLCTGNLSLVRLAKDSLQSFANVEFTGVDFAQIGANEFVENNPNVRLLGEVNIENLPFENEIFDHVISNFGIEYSDLSNSIAEAARVLKKGGKVDFICHHERSNLIKSSKEELAFISDVLKLNGPMSQLEALINAIHKEGLSKSLPQAKKDSEAESLRESLNKAMSELLDKYGSYLYNSEFMKFFKFIFSKQASDKLFALNSYKAELTGYQVRISAMVNSALNDESVSAFNKRLVNNGFEQPKNEAVFDENVMIGYKIASIKSLK